MIKIFSRLRRLSDGQRDTSQYKLGQLGLEKDRKFVYLFDFGDEWDFGCKVLKVIDGVCEDTKVLRSVGETHVPGEDTPQQR